MVYQYSGKIIATEDRDLGSDLPTHRSWLGDSVWLIGCLMEKDLVKLEAEVLIQAEINQKSGC